MRKLLIMIVLEVIITVFCVKMEDVIPWADELSDHAFLIWGICTLILAGLCWPEIKAWCFPSAYDRAMKEQERADKRKVREEREWAERAEKAFPRHPLIGKSTYDPVTKTMSVGIGLPKSRFERLIKIALWLVNHRLLPYGILARLANRFGWKIVW